MKIEHAKMKPTSLKGLTLIEVAVALGLAAVTSTIAVLATMGLTQSVRVETKKTTVYDEAKIIDDYLTSLVQQAGGGHLRAGHSVDATFGSGGTADELRVTLLDPAHANECFVDSAAGSVVTFRTTDTDNDGVADKCCLEGMPARGNFALVPSSGSLVHFRSEALNTSVSGCTAVVQPDPFVTLPSPLPSLSGAIVVPIRHIRVTHDDTTNELRLTVARTDLPAAEQTVLTDAVRDFQVALGFDMPSADGVIFDGANTTDEWMGNVSSDNVATFVNNRSDMRMVRLGFVLERPLGNDQSYSAQIMDGAALAETGTLLRASVVEASLRNTYFFE